jgi:two-component system, cell cycle response regulator
MVCWLCQTHPQTVYIQTRSIEIEAGCDGCVQMAISKGAEEMAKKVLTIDDSKTLRMIVGKHLSPFGVQLLQAENGEQGIVCARENNPDVILLDYNMPVMDGYHTLIELKADPQLKDIPVVMLTTETVQETVIKLAKLGLKDYIAKPFTREVLLQKLNPILSLYEGSGVPSDKPAPAPGSMGNSGKLTILAIDDKANILDLIKEYFADQFNLITADSGQAALQIIAQKKFDYMFLDLSLPDIHAFDVLKAYLQGNGPEARKNVVAMTLRTAQTDISRVSSAGVGIFLYKPFSRDDIAEAIHQVVSRQKEEKKMRYLATNGKVRILDCPPEKNPKFRLFANALSSAIIQEIDEMAEEGLSRLVIKVGEGFLSDLSITRKFVNLMDHIIRLSMNVRLVADSDQAREALKQYAETASLPTDSSLELALNSMGAQ